MSPVVRVFAVQKDAAGPAGFLPPGEEPLYCGKTVLLAVIAAVARVRLKRRQIEFAGRVEFDQFNSDFARDAAGVFDIVLR